jgi:hypothetical protein
MIINLFIKSSPLYTLSNNLRLRLTLLEFSNIAAVLPPEGPAPS